ncbi:hypothetical protein ANAPC3_00027 [Anaplasma phagocytophilum]|uniref:Uncharacterized protein n=1 Tax=Anaplasma phagocytophilum str. Norway variant2 TaxID=1392507 RepID=A0A161IGX7_ANAPH|nr:hypothetical protein P029_03785 [Anaplasma phagocytophilum str. Norway variant2]SBO29898.1 hypothetical protein ANAPC3_00027 [Anaplasma phagocytophilum]SBO30466.1 hypothetical protein ANAPC2_00258 [Anaplasma phagocytophilum]SBO31325.1 hypothetical protein ANAPC4_00452 [Anaplasma phagocytophilum]
MVKYTAETKVTSGNENDVALRRGEGTHWQYALKPGARSRTGGIHLYVVMLATSGDMSSGYEAPQVLELCS